MGRSVVEVTHMAKKVKQDGYRVASTVAEQEPSKPAKVKTRTTATSAETEWSQMQQKALEVALTKYPKGANADRWEKVAKCVPGKSKVRCTVHLIGQLRSFVG
jgi:DnaJ family protein C protein 1